MKRILAVFLALALLSVAAAAAAEPFTLHAKTAFGMTEDEVRAAESAAGFELQDNSANAHIKGVKGKIAGQAGSTSWFVFDEQNGLVQVAYRFPSQDSFDEIEEALTSKYGTTEYTNETQKTLPDTKKSDYSGKDMMEYPIVFKSDYFTCPHYSLRILPLDDGSYVVITHKVADWQYTGAAHSLSYTHIPASQYDRLMNGGNDGGSIFDDI